MRSICTFVKMHVNWRALYICAGLFWLAMCAVEYVYGAIINKGEFSKVPDVDEYIPIKIKRKEQEIIGYDSRNLIFWGMFSMTSSLCVFIFIKLLKVNYKKNRKPGQHIIDDCQNISENEDARFSDLTSANNESKLAIVGPTLLEVVKDFPVTIEHSEISHRPAENRLRRISESSPEQHSALVKEFTALTKRFEVLLKEKKDLSKKLLEAQKECKESNQQLQEITGNRSLLIKKLEIATREIKLNTKTKKETMHKLEDAVECSNLMKNKLIELTNDNIQLANKVRSCEAQYISLQEYAAKLEQHQQITCITLKDVSVSSMSIEKEKIQETEPELDASESEKEIEKVQNKLQDLEKSLELMRLSVKGNDGGVENGAVKEAESEDITSREYVTEYAYEIQKLNIVADPLPENVDNSIRFRQTDQYDNQQQNNVDLLYSSYDTSTECDSKAGSVSSFSQTTINSEYEFENEVTMKGIVSQSPAFQKFLLKVLDH